MSVMRTSRPGISASAWVSTSIRCVGGGAGCACDGAVNVITPQVTADETAAARTATNPWEVMAMRLMALLLLSRGCRRRLRRASGIERRRAGRHAPHLRRLLERVGDAQQR